ncbi:MAG: hypothetical protein EPN72_11325 [Nevskiaceae bacterium]|nr:MAG: hypothetical protein EPN63_01655 [Nevskiaceae bacterium]TBR71789.1 MAG: hypothetical protein EPN72_11325 [Nevskiaceae bacterium]
MFDASPPPALPVDGFDPHGLLRNGHVQTTLASLRPVAADPAGMRAAAQRRVLDCGGGVHLLGAWSRHPQARCLAVLIHGWRGSQDSRYLDGLACHLYAAGHSVLRLNLRDHGDSQVLNKLPFHSGRIAEVIGACHAARMLEPGVPLFCIGFSLGGNFALRVGIHGPAAGLTPRLCIGVSPAIQPRATLAALDRNPVYRRYFMRRWRAGMENKMHAWPGRYEGFRELVTLSHFTPITQRFAARYTEYADADAYLKAYTISPKQIMASPTPLAIITAQDDPLIPFADFSALHAGGALQTFLTPRHGGHCGFIENRHMDCWAERAVARLIDTALAPESACATA